MAKPAPVTAIVLAAQRAGVVNPLAKRAGVSHKCIVPICGKPLILHVIEALATLPSLARVRVSVEPEAHAGLEALLAPYAAQGMRIEFVASSPNIADSALAAAAGQGGPFIITTGDNVLLTRRAIEDVLERLQHAEAVITLASKPSVQAIHPEAQRRFYEFRDEGYANCNLYGIAGPHAFGGVEAFREGGQFMNNPKRLIAAFGLFNIILFRLKLVTLAGAIKLLSRRFGMRMAAYVPADGSQAVDVDNERTYEVAEMVLKQRAAAGG